MEEVIPRKKMKFMNDFEPLLNDIFLDPEERCSASLNDSYVVDEEAVAGKIKRVKLQNFMCHSNLEFNFGDKINFISGKNGSGKSAILTALVIGLGGRTADTNRGQSIKNLIQNGKNRATIEITIINSGPTRFKHHLYGDTIKVVRTITGSSSQYKIFSDRGEVISTKRDEIDLINMYLNIQVNNPVTILNQDTARTFLKSATPKELYDIFMKGTHLEETEKTILSLKHEKLPLLAKMIEEKKERHKEAYQDVNEYRKKLKNYKKLEKHQDEAVVVQNDLYWAHVHKIETKLNEQKNFENECEKQLPLLRDKVNKRDKMEQELKEKQKSLENDLKEMKESTREIENESLEFERSKINAKEQISKKMNEIQRVQKHVESERKACQELETAINNHDSQTAETENRKKMLKTQCQELQKRLEELKAVMSTTQVHEQQLSDTRNVASSKLAQKQGYYDNLKRKLAYKEETLASLKTEKNQFMVYSKWMPELVDNIEKAYRGGKFKQKPRGPLGSYIKLKYKNWGPAIENYIGARRLSSFFVDNNQDYKTLKSIIDRVNIPTNMKPVISIGKFFDKVFDVSRNETGNEHYTNLLRSIIISDPVVTNCLIDSVEPEAILLVPTSEEAYKLLEDKRNVPINCKRAFTLNGDLYYPAPNSRSYAGNVEGTTRFLQVSQQQAVKQADQEVCTIKEELARCEDDLVKADIEAKRSVEESEEVKREIFKLDRQITACENKLDVLNDKLKQEELADPCKVQDLKDDLIHRQGNIETCEDKIKVLENEKKCLVAKYKEASEKYENTQAKKSAKVEEMKKIQSEINVLNQEYCKISSGSDNYVSLLKKEEAKLAKVKEIIANLQNDLNKAENDAKEAHPERISETKGIELLEKDLQKIQGMIKALENIIGDINAVPDNYLLKVKKFQEEHETLENLTDIVEKGKEVEKRLSEKYKKVKKLESLNTRQTFLDMLQKKKFTGGLIIDHEKKHLKVVIKVESAANDVSSTLTLSGGERSYSMVSFIMALWKNMFSPFYFLDEFDVFMDEINRDMIMSMLLEYARSRPDQQFVFLTPHANLNNELLREVKFFRMNDPRSQDDE